MRGKRMEIIGSRAVYEGQIASVRIATYRHADGAVVEREVVSHPGAVAVVAHDDVHIYLVRQPREAVGEEATLELPAGKLDRPGESPIDCARREFAEEVGLEAGKWSELKRFHTSPGFSEEEVIVYLATALRWVEHRPDPEERIEVAPWPLEDLDGAIAECADAKSLIGLLILRDILR
jgi:ADP-ribose pyrophosphatase